jgi:hypothetical protein
MEPTELSADLPETSTEPKIAPIEPVKTFKMITGGNLAKYPPLLPGKTIPIRTIKDAKRLFTKLISGFQKGQILGKDAKDLAYLLSAYLQTCNVDLEERVKQLEITAKKGK